MTDAARPRHEVEARIAEFVKAVDAYVADHYKAQYPGLYEQGFYPTHEIERGPKYIRVVAKGRSQRSVYCFLNWNGDIFKSESWKKPAKHIRGSIFDDNFSLGKGLNTYGAVYLR